jgi:sulfite exporter TauE/SafE
MQTELPLLIITAITIACLHTATGPDHYLPFIALSKSRGWSFMQTVLWTVVCGCGHVWSSVLLGLGGAAVGWSLSSIKWFEFVRGGIAGWVMLLFGFTYAVWGAIRSSQNRPHKHFDIFDDNSVYVYEHRHGDVVPFKERHAVTPWVLFVIFVLGPCEPMIPLLYFPAAKSSWWSMMLLIGVYTFFTLVTMLIMVTGGYYGLSFMKMKTVQRHIHTLGGVTIFICGLGMVFLNW